MAVGVKSKKKTIGGTPPWESFPFYNNDTPDWLPGDDAKRAATYDSYESMYWSQDDSFTLRVLVTEQPLYIPNARVICDTISHYLMKGLKVALEDPEKYADYNELLTSFLDREMFYPRFHTAKHAGCVRGDFALHMTADPDKPAGQRISLTSVHPGKVTRVFDDDDAECVTEVFITEPYTDPAKPDKPLVRRLHYFYDDLDSESGDSYIPGVDDQADVATGKTVMSEEMILENDDKLWSETEPATLYKMIEAAAPLDSPVDTIPVYWFKNIPWDNQPYGSSDIRGVERLIRSISQEGSDLATALALDGLGVYSTDASRPKNTDGSERNWTVEPGQILELQNGTYFKRVDGIKSVTPALDVLNYFEGKMYGASGISSVSTGDVDAQTASSPMALEIKFLPTLAKISERDHLGVARLKNLFFDWTKWMAAYEETPMNPAIKITVKIGDKLPQDRTERINELNNMLDRDIISRAYYREEMQQLGYVFPDDIQAQVDADRKADLKFNAPLNQAPNIPAETQAQMAAAGIPIPTGGSGDPAAMPPGVNGQKSTTLPPPGSTSNNKNKVNESKGTEADQSLKKQATGAKPVGKNNK